MGNDRSESIRTESARPTFRGQYLERFLHLIAGIDGQSPVRQREGVSKELEWLRGRSNDDLDVLKYRAMLMVLRDLMGQGWSTRYRQHAIFLSRPDYTKGKDSRLDPLTVKALIRQAYHEERLARMGTESVRRFIIELEEATSNKSSISDLMIDGEDLLPTVKALSANPTLEQAKKVMAPYLQLVEGEERDLHTGIIYHQHTHFLMTTSGDGCFVAPDRQDCGLAMETEDSPSK